MPNPIAQEIASLLAQGKLKSVVQMKETAIEPLTLIAGSSNAALGIKAVKAAVQINCDDSVKVLEAGAKSRQAIVRAMVAREAPSLGEAALPIITYLLQSTDASVRIFAIHASGSLQSEELKQAFARIVKNDPVKSLKSAAKAVLMSWDDQHTETVPSSAQNR